MWPIFIFGTGRCGSTHLQRLLTMSTRCWIWGEHGGFLEPLLEAIRTYETSEGLEKFVFGRAPRNDERLVSDMMAGVDMLSWVNEFDKDALRAEIISLIDRMFRSRVPKSWDQWGFKEIRYGLDNNTPSMLLNLFPDATSVFTFRDPKGTIESMIRTWAPGLLDASLSVEELWKTYQICCNRWLTIIDYFLKHREQVDSRIIFVSSDKLNRPTQEILTTLGLSPTRPSPDHLVTTNRGPAKISERARSIFDELFARKASVCLDIFARACALSDADFGARTHSL
jgi:hypothetical protein